jgi:hypothetical protein
MTFTGTGAEVTDAGVFIGKSHRAERLHSGYHRERRYHISHPDDAGGEIYTAINPPIMGRYNPNGPKSTRRRGKKINAPICRYLDGDGAKVCKPTRAQGREHIAACPSEAGERVGRTMIE